MTYSNQFFQALGVDHRVKSEIKAIASKTEIPLSRLNFYNHKNVVPSGFDLMKITEIFGVSEVQLRLKMGRLDRTLIELIQNSSDQVLRAIGQSAPDEQSVSSPKEVLETPLGKLYEADCLEVLRSIESDSVDLVFADPPFNLDKLYPSNMDDNIREEEYLKWMEQWLKECVRVLKHGGALFTWNLPLWNSSIANFLHGSLTFKHWVGVDIKYSLPIQGRLYPSHYSLLYFVKGEKANKLVADRLPTPTCPSCYGDIKDYGGYKHKMNPLGISLTDIWTDIPPVRHAKYKKRIGSNELSIKLLDRIIEMSTNEGDLVFDPFGGSGTTYVVSELKGRRWIGCEVGPCEDIIQRFDNISEDRDHLERIRAKLNHLFVPAIARERELRGLWTAKSVSKKNE
jgi:site-specific DNA-methyltransferase (adenine-specific)